jgi:hypothetical protein
MSPVMPKALSCPSVLTTLNFLFVGSMITVSCGTLLTRLAQSLDELHLFAASLEEGKDALHAMNAELRLTGAALAQLNDKVLIGPWPVYCGSIPPRATKNITQRPLMQVGVVVSGIAILAAEDR